MARQAGRVGAVVPLFGSKRQMSSDIVQYIGPHDAYLAPFVGSCAVELAKPVARMEILNDLSGHLVNLLQVVADDDRAAELHWRVGRTTFCEPIYLAAVDWLRCNPPPPWESVQDGPGAHAEAAYRYLVASWMGRNGLVGTTGELDTGFCVRYTSGGGDPAARWRAVADSLPWWWQRLRQATILRRNGIDLCERFQDRAGAVIYADPPYLAKQATYIHDFADADHERLAAALRRFKLTRVVVSYYDDQRLAALYPGWRKVAVGVTKNLSVRRDGGVETAPEVLLINQLAV